MTIRYYAAALNTRTVEDPHYIFREISTKDDYRTDVWDRAAEQWKIMMSLVRYTKNGEPGAPEITKAQADSIIERWRQR